MPPRKRSMSFVVNDATNVRVYVRVRPFNSRERDSGILKPAVRCEGKVAYMYDVETEAPKEERFTFDECFWSNNDFKSPNAFATQESIYNEVGSILLDNAFKGYHACLFAYGQTGSGKTFTMMGDRNKEELWGMIPRICNGMFQRIETEKKNPSVPTDYKVQVGYIEIYNELLKDLLGAGKGFVDVKIRDHPVYGPTVEGNKLQQCATLDDINKVMASGDHRRTVAATAMNATSSRSHAVFTLMFTQVKSDQRNGKTISQTLFSKINLIDLAGSERVEDSGVTGAQFKEAVNINKSLTTLGRVMDALVELSQGKKGIIPPYRESILTRTLQDSLGGNSKTMMFANVSPSPLNFEETLSTLRYSSRARNIVNNAKVNSQSTAGPGDLPPPEEKNDEMEELKKALADAKQNPALQGELDAAKDDLNAARGNLGDAQSKLQAKEGEVKNLEGQMNSLESEIQDLEAKARRLVEVEKEKTTLEGDTDGLSTDKSRLEKEVARLKGVESEQASQVSSQAADLKRIKAEIEEVGRNHESTKSKLTRENDETTASLEDSRRKRETLEGQLRELTENFTKSKARAENLNRDLAEAIRERDELLEDNRLLQIRVKKQAAEIVDLEARVAKERKKSAEYLMSLASIEDSVGKMGIKVPY